MELKGKKMNVIGDSITQGVGTSAKEFIYVNRLEASEGFEVVRNYGVSGTRIANQPNGGNCGGAFTERYKTMDDDAGHKLIADRVAGFLKAL